MRDAPALDRDRVRELFDLKSSYLMQLGGGYEEDPYPTWHRLRARAPVHPGIVHELTGYERPAVFAGLPYADRPHFSAFSYDACEAAFRDDEAFSSSAEPVDLVDGALTALNSILSMSGVDHRRYRWLVQPSFVPAKAEWWICNWIDESVHLLIDGFVDQGRAELNVEFCAAIPVMTITGSFGVPVEQALDIRASLAQPGSIVEILAGIVAARRESPADDLISVLVHAERTDDDGVAHRLTDNEIYSFAMLLLTAGSGAPWRQMGITVMALLERPDILRAVKDDRSLLRAAVEESLRWTTTNPMFSRFVTHDIDFFGVHLPKGAVLHLCLGAANRDPARWERPDDYDVHRPMKPSLAFGGGPHICLGMHLARAELMVGIGSLLDRLPELRLDPDEPPPRVIGMYERGAMELPVIFG
jgi:cytochrome P450